MKGLAAGIVILVVIALGGFLYRNMYEHPVAPGPGSLAEPQACTTDARVCPDGSSLGRTSPNCTFPACPPPNVSLESVHVAFALPVGYSENRNALGQDPSLVDAFEKTSKSSMHAIVVRDYAIPEGKTATSTILANTMYEPSGMQPASFKSFAVKLINGRTFYCTTLERFEGQVHTACFLPRAADVLRFEVLEKDVDWTNPNLDIDSLPEHKAFYTMLTTLQIS